MRHTLDKAQWTCHISLQDKACHWLAAHVLSIGRFTCPASLSFTSCFCQDAGNIVPPPNSHLGAPMYAGFGSSLKKKHFQCLKRWQLSCGVCVMYASLMDWFMDSFYWQKHTGVLNVGTIHFMVIHKTKNGFKKATEKLTNSAWWVFLWICW